MAQDCVIVLHGLAKSDSTMSELASKLTQSGFYTVNVDYPSRKYPIEKLAAQAIEPALKECRTENPKLINIHFVTHSMGGILVRQYMSEHDIAELSKVVMKVLRPVAFISFSSSQNDEFKTQV